jgi:hypothetical protein
LTFQILSKVFSRWRLFCKHFYACNINFKVKIQIVRQKKQLWNDTTFDDEATKNYSD